MAPKLSKKTLLLTDLVVGSVVGFERVPLRREGKACLACVVRCIVYADARELKKYPAGGYIYIFWRLLAFRAFFRGGGNIEANLANFE